MSNLLGPDLAPYFRLCKPAKQNMGHDAPSDPDYEPDCQFMTHDEALILFHVAARVGGEWLDLGARFGWTGAHILAARAAGVVMIDQCLVGERLGRLTANMEKLVRMGAGYHPEFRKRTVDNRAVSDALAWNLANGKTFDGMVIDADHDPPQPLNDATGCLYIAKRRSVIVFHDFWGEPIRDGVRLLVQEGWGCRVYMTPNGVAVLWRGFENAPVPEHTPDPKIDWAEVRRTRAPEFDWSVCV